MVYVVLRQGYKAADTEEGLRSLCEKELPEYARPLQYVFREELPLAPIEKVDYLKLEQLAADKQDN